MREGGTAEGSGRLLKSVRGTERLGRRGRGGCEGDLFCSSSSPSAVRRARRLRRALPDTAVTVLHKKRPEFWRKCISLWGYAASLCVLVRDENRQLIAILRANVIR